MAITKDSKEALKNRLARVMGHLDAVYRMVDEERYCIDVLHQMKAVQAGLDKSAEVILKQHLETCVVEAMQNQDSERVIEELLQVFRKAPELYNSGEAFSEAALSEIQKAHEGKTCCH